MAGMYPDDQSLNIYGQPVTWPGMDPDTGKFTNGDFTDPLKKPSFIPAESINLILDNLSELIKSMAGVPGNQALDQLAKLFTSAATPNKGVVRDVSGRAKVAAPAASDDIARKAEVDAEATARGNGDTNLQNQINTKAPLASPNFTGTPRENGRDILSIASLSLEQNGYIIFNNGFKIEWGFATSTNSSIEFIPISFPILFSSWCSVFRQNSSTTTNNDSVSNRASGIINKTLSGFTIGAIAALNPIMWFAIGV